MLSKEERCAVKVAAVLKGVTAPSPRRCAGRCVVVHEYNIRNVAKFRIRRIIKNSDDGEGSVSSDSVPS